MNQTRGFLVGAVCLLSVVASAQWQWLDKGGQNVYSDRAPPPDVLEKDILKRPPVVAAAASAPAAAMQHGGASAPRLGGVDKDLLERKKKAEEAEAARRQAEQERILKVKVDNCARAKQAKANFDSGRPIARINEKGESEIMDATTRAAEVQRIQSILDTDCK